MSNQATPFKDSSKVTQQVIAALRDSSYGFEIAHSAWQFAQNVKKANELLRRCADRMSQGDSTDAYIAYESNRHLVDAVESLDAPSREAWNQRCTRFAWEKPEPLKTGVAHILADAFSHIESLKPTLLDEYRSRIQRKGPRDAYAIIKLLANALPDDTAIQTEHKRITTELVNALEADLIMCYSSSKAAEESAATLRKYRARGLALPTNAGPIEDAVAEERKAASILLEKEIAKLPETLDGEAETRLFALQQKIDDAGIGAKLTEKLRPLRDRLAQRRDLHDTQIALRQTLEALKTTPKDKALHQTFRDQCAKAQQDQLALPADLQAEIAAAEASLPKLKNAKPAPAPAPAAKAAPTPAPKPAPAPKSEATAKSKTPIFIAAGAAAAIAIGGFFVFSGGDEPSTPAAAQTPAKAAASPLAEAAQALQLAAKAPIDDASEQAYQSLLAKARQLSQETPGDQTSAAAIAAAIKLREDNRRAHVAAASAKAKTLLQDAAKAVAAAAELAGQESFAPNHERAAAALAKAAEAASLASEPAPHAATVESLNQQLADAAKLDEARAAKLRALAKAETFAAYYAGLETLAASSHLADGEREQVQALLASRSRSESSMDRLAQFKDLSPSSPLRSGPVKRGATVTLDPTEVAHLERLVDQTEFASTYVSEVKYFQSSASPVSVTQAYLAEPVVATSQVNGGRVNTVFSVRGFDEDGRPRPSSLQANHSRVANGDGTGQFYEPSTLAPESQYYSEVLNPALKNLLGKTDPIDPLALIDGVASQQALSPLFRLFWIQQIDELMAYRPEQWPYRQSPSLERARERIEAYAPTTISAYRWIAVGPQIPDRANLDAFLDDIASSHLVEEATAFSLIAGFAEKGRFVVAGHVNEQGAPVLRSTSTDGDSLWSIDSANGALAPLAAQPTLLPFAPVLAYRIAGVPSRDTLVATSEHAGIDLLQQQYASHLPEVLRILPVP